MTNRIEDVTNFIQLVSPQLVDQFPQTKLPCKVPNEAIHTYMGCTKVTTNDWDIRLSVAVKALSANILWTAGWICTIELAFGSAHWSFSNDMWYISQK